MRKEEREERKKEDWDIKTQISLCSSLISKQSSSLFPLSLSLSLSHQTFNDLQLYGVVREVEALADGLHDSFDEFFPSLCAAHVRDVPSDVPVGHHFLYTFVIVSSLASHFHISSLTHTHSREQEENLVAV